MLELPYELLVGLPVTHWWQQLLVGLIFVALIAGSYFVFQWDQNRKHVNITKATQEEKERQERVTR